VELTTVYDGGEEHPYIEIQPDGLPTPYLSKGIQSVAVNTATGDILLNGVPFDKVKLAMSTAYSLLAEVQDLCTAMKAGEITGRAFSSKERSDPRFTPVFIGDKQVSEIGKPQAETIRAE
jgi:hypothetical protein